MRDTLKLVELLELSHPDPYTNMGGTIAFKRKSRDLVAAIPAEGIQTSELGNRLSVFLAGLHDGHTHLRDSPAPEPTACSVPSGSIQLRLPKGQLRVDGAVDPASLRIVLQYLLG